MELNKIYNENCLDTLARMPDGFLDSCVTSPPYFGLRDYGTEGQFGLEKTPDEYVSNMVQVFREVRRCMKDSGTLWLNIGDSYSQGGSGQNFSSQHGSTANSTKPLGGYGHIKTSRNPKTIGLKPKDLIGIPWMLAFALRADGWYLRQDIIWHKPNPMPESVTDRCTKSHEYIFLLSKSERYFFDHEAIQEEAIENKWQERLERQSIKSFPDEQKNGIRTRAKFGNRNGELNGLHSGKEWEYTGKRNKRSVWTVTTKPFSGAHFATFPQDLIIPCIQAGCPEGGTVYDPFMGAGTTALVAHRLKRNWIGSEISPEYVALANKRLESYLTQLSMF